MKRLVALLLLAFCGLAFGQSANLQPFQLQGNSVTFTAATSCPTPVQATTGQSNTTQFLLTNIGANTAFVSFGTSAQATANCAIPASSGSLTIPVLPLSQITISGFAGMFFTGITAASTSVIYLSPGAGN